jgi:antitoxin MazE
MTITIQKWGNSQGIRISKELLNLLGIAVNEEVDLSIENNRLIVSKSVQRQSLEEYARPYGGKLGPYKEFDFGDGIGIERWLDESD